jgi:hypothetical protein
MIDAVEGRGIPLVQQYSGARFHWSQYPPSRQEARISRNATIK